MNSFRQFPHCWRVTFHLARKTKKPLRGAPPLPERGLTVGWSTNCDNSPIVLNYERCKRWWRTLKNPILWTVLCTHYGFPIMNRANYEHWRTQITGNLIFGSKWRWWTWRDWFFQRQRGTQWLDCPAKFKVGSKSYSQCLATRGTHDKHWPSTHKQTGWWF